jgi:hypothetical protein
MTRNADKRNPVEACSAVRNLAALPMSKTSSNYLSAYRPTSAGGPEFGEATFRFTGTPLIILPS